jgi:hypothetical protein
MAAFVAPKLAEWHAWEATGEFVALIEAGTVADPAAEFAIRTCQLQSPDPAAQALFLD